MTSTPNSASTARMLRRFATRPEWFAVLTGAAYGPPLLATELLGQGRDQMSITAGPVLLSQIAWCVLVLAVLLTALGWWGTAGFTRRSTWRSLIPFLPLILLFGVLPLLGLVFGPGVASHSPGYLSLAALTMHAVGFGEEATFRGVVLQTLLPRGRMRAVLLSSVLYGVASIGVISSGRYPVLAGVQPPATRCLFAAPTRSRMRPRGCFI
jgi:CAAX protease family protein